MEMDMAIVIQELAIGIGSIVAVMKGVTMVMNGGIEDNLFIQALGFLLMFVSVFTLCVMLFVKLYCSF